MTIADIQDSITEREMLVWSMYFKKHGPVNPQRMFDQGHAIVSSQINNSSGGKAKPNDFMPYFKEHEEDVEVSSDIFEGLLLKGGKRGR